MHTTKYYFYYCHPYPALHNPNSNPQVCFYCNEKFTYFMTAILRPIMESPPKWAQLKWTVDFYAKNPRRPRVEYRMTPWWNLVIIYSTKVCSSTTLRESKSPELLWCVIIYKIVALRITCHLPLEIDSKLAEGSRNDELPGLIKSMILFSLGIDSAKKPLAGHPVEIWHSENSLSKYHSGLVSPPPMLQPLVGCCTFLPFGWDENVMLL